MVLKKRDSCEKHTVNKIVGSSGHCKDFACFDWKEADLFVVGGGDLVQCSFAATSEPREAVQAWVSSSIQNIQR